MIELAVGRIFLVRCENFLWIREVLQILGEAHAYGPELAELAESPALQPEDPFAEVLVVSMAKRVVRHDGIADQHPGPAPPGEPVV